MPMTHILSCDRCGMQWRWLQMKKEPLPPCPNLQCGHAETSKELAAPAVARGAAPATSWAVPDTQAKREKFAFEMAQGMGVTNMKDNVREGEIQAMPVPEPTVTAPNGRVQKVPFGFQNVGGTPEAVHSQIASFVGGSGGAHTNRAAIDVLGGMKRRR